MQQSNNITTRRRGQYRAGESRDTTKYLKVIGNPTKREAKLKRLDDRSTNRKSRIENELMAPPSSLRFAPRCFLENLALLRLKLAWRAALQLDEKRYWLALSNKVQSWW